MPCNLRLARHGAILLVLGLLSGFAAAVVPVPRMALSAHTIGALQGTLAIALSFLWPVLESHGQVLRHSYWMLVTGLYANWIGALLAAAWSAKWMMLVHGPEMPDLSTHWQEIVVAILLNLSLLALVALVNVAVAISRILSAGGRA